MKVEFLHQASGAQKELSLLKEEGRLKNFTQSDFTEYPPIQPRTMIDELNDREMATAYLLTLKRAGREYAWLAMEAANPELRAFLQTAFMMSCSHAYEVWQYMVSKGYYPLEEAPQSAVEKVGKMFQIIPEDQPQIQQYYNQYHNPASGNNNQLS
jgi:spore coat protein CotF